MAPVNLSVERLERALAALRAGGSATVESLAEGARMTVWFDAGTGGYMRSEQDMFGGSSERAISEAEAAAFLDGCSPEQLPG